MVEMMNNERFIQCVEKFPDLWDRKSKYYKDRNVRENDWNTIGNQMFSDWHDLSEEQRRDKVMHMKRKWRNIRDSFMRCLHQLRRGSSAAKRKKYVYEDYLSFLLNTSPKKRASKRKAEDQTDSTRIPRDEDEDESDTLLTPKNEADNEVDVDEVEIDENDLLELLPKTKVFEEELVFSAPPQFRAEKTDQTRKEEEDADRSFLMSLLPDMRKLDDGQRLDFRFHCLQFFRDLRQSGGVESTNSYSSSP